ncbi:tRNA pseudouridine38-40 synthase [Breznakibacter xylanolyticus]|uniref:tRNA pseudouridine synthase A n=1 Tax=Breznakibacter xylanolyticus TaxID=990 RepID=A0A2W7NSB4_9BACT|nr:tRNA pseudouridine38-40 synthase [Breznakibacter xylanolyticus]
MFEWESYICKKCIQSTRSIHKTLRYFLHIGFNGFQYRGWQRLPGIISVQQVIEEALTAILKQPIEIVGCGRTDAQVNASQYFFHMDVADPWDFDLMYRLNKRLPPDISIYDIFTMHGLPHARFDAISRSYDYLMHSYKDPYLHPISSLYNLAELDVDLMQQAVAILPRYNDYYALCKKPNKNDHTICNVSEAWLLTDDKRERMQFHISSNRFLGGMIRIIVHKLLEIGQKKLTVEAFETILADKKTPSSIKSALPQGLHLSKVTYPYLDIPTRSQFMTFLEK